MDHLVKKRGSTKMKQTVFRNYINNVLAINSDESKQIDEHTSAEIVTRLTRLDDTFAQFDTLQSQIDEITEDEKDTIEYRENFENEYYGLVKIAKKLLARGAPMTQSNSSKDAPGQINPAQANPAQAHEISENIAQLNLGNDNLQPPTSFSMQSEQYNNNTRSVKLPTIELPKFNGDLSEWLGFRDTFESLIHHSNNIVEIQKFHYLKASLNGDAEKIIKSLQFSAENYIIAWEALCERYNNKKVLINNHIRMIFEMEKINKESSVLLQNIVDNLNKHLRALRSLEEPTEHWDSILIYSIASKLDAATSRAWTKEKSTIPNPRLKEFVSFLKTRAEFLQTVEDTDHNEKSNSNCSKKQNQTKTKTFLALQKPKCALCKSDHYIQNCEEFLKLDVHQRAEKLKQLRLCLNCLRAGHFVPDCRLGGCKKCQAKHNTLIHFDRNERKKDQVVTLCTSSNASVSSVILATASIIAKSSRCEKKARAVLDSCSQSSFITEKLCNLLKLKKTPVNVSVGTINSFSSDLNVKYKCELDIITHHNDFKFSLACLVVPEIVDNMPNSKINLNEINIPHHLKLADPLFHSPGKVDILIGAEMFWGLLCIGQIQLNQLGLVIQKTKLGWVVGGPLATPMPKHIQCNLTYKSGLEAQLQKFWELEECSGKKALSKEEQMCESNFRNTVQRNSDGKFIVKIPFKGDPKCLGDSKHLAERRLHNLERRLDKNPKLKNDYSEFLMEYEQLGHMTKVSEQANEIAYYLPHHCVIREESESTKTRVVFDGSAKTTSGVSLNDIQMVGPVIQDDLFSILVRFRKHTYVISADIEKMYRQVLVDPEQRVLQRILWRAEPTLPIQIYNLNTVTYGTAAASFLAIRALTQAAFDCELEAPEISKIISHDFYVDDMLTGAESIEEAKCIVNKISGILKRSAFTLRKWASNEPSIIEDVSERIQSPNNIEFSERQNKRTLGLLWGPSKDTLTYSVPLATSNKVSKRQILSEIAQIFDPLGLLGPSIVIAKTLLQKLWSENLSWDESLPSILHSEWCAFREQLADLNKLEIARQITCRNPSKLQIHGFADASKTAYGACVYIKSKDSSERVQVSLLCSKNKVAPLKTQTIPRLELCAALELARLIEKVKVSIDAKIDEITCWSDSTIVLAWLKSQPNALPVFESNRVARIQDLTSDARWRHVPTEMNPADLLSRGVVPKQLIKNELWWNGPQFLTKNQSEWPEDPKAITGVSKPQTSVSVLSINTYQNQTSQVLFSKTSSLSKLIRIMAYILRFTNAVQNKGKQSSLFIRKEESEIALKTLVKLSQEESFFMEKSMLTAKKLLRKGKIATLSPFLDESGLLRVGGRLSNSNYVIDKKHPLILDSRHILTQLIMEDAHLRSLHAAPQLLLATVREKFWPLRGRNLARRVVNKCIVCFRANPKAAGITMGNLPNSRLTPTLPFITTGVDYAGPFFIKDKRGRGCKLVKCYISLFVCFSTKALHLEIVSDLTKESFISALRRFVSRRGLPKDIYSDNGTSFTGAHNELNELGKFLLQEYENLGESIDSLGITWHFIPAYSPHFGGLWEAGVKSTKFHLKRVCSSANLTYEEFYTILVQVESILNSRPLTPLSNDPNDMTPLTPAHFLIGRTYLAVADPTLLHIKEQRLSNWQRVQQLQQHIWSRWNKEYVSEMQTKTKWRNPYPEIKLGTLALIKDDNLPPAKWKLGRIIENHPGKDNISRVASLKTTSGIVRRAYTKICPLPINDDIVQQL